MLCVAADIQPRSSPDVSRHVLPVEQHASALYLTPRLD